LEASEYQDPLETCLYLSSLRDEPRFREILAHLPN